jgi:hypothetical protein
MDDGNGIGQTRASDRLVWLLPFLFAIVVVACWEQAYYPHGGLELRFLRSLKLGAVFGAGLSVILAAVLGRTGLRPVWRHALGWAAIVPLCLLGWSLALGITRGGMYVLAWHVPLSAFVPCWLVFALSVDEALSCGGRRLFADAVALIGICFAMGIALAAALVAGFFLGCDLRTVTDWGLFVVLPFACVVSAPVAADRMLRRFPKLGNRIPALVWIPVLLSLVFAFAPLVRGLSRSARLYPDAACGSFGSARDDAFDHRKHAWETAPVAVRTMMLLESGGDLSAARRRYPLPAVKRKEETR